MNVDHVCIAVRSIKSSKKRLCEILQYEEKTEVVKNTRQDVLVQFFSKPGSLDIKMIQPASPASPLTNFLKSRGEGLHHLCFKAEDVNQTMDELLERGARKTAEPLPGEAFDDELIAFAYVAGGLNIEIIDTDKRRNPL